MKQKMNLLSFSKWPVYGFALVLLLFTACKKDNPVTVHQPAAGLMAFNLAADKPAIGFSLSNNTLGNAALNFGAYTGTYAPIFIGSREVRSFDYITGSTIALTTQEFKDSAYYSVFLVGAYGNYKNVVVKDNFDQVKPAMGKAWVRYINAIADSTTTPAIAIGEATEAAAFATVSAFKQVNAGPVNVSANNGNAINTSRTITLEENKIYTVLFLGLPNQTDSTKAIGIRYIQNGTATE